MTAENRDGTKKASRLIQSAINCAYSQALEIVRRCLAGDGSSLELFDRLLRVRGCDPDSLKSSLTQMARHIVESALSIADVSARRTWFLNATRDTIDQFHNAEGRS